MLPLRSKLRIFRLWHHKNSIMTDKEKHQDTCEKDTESVNEKRALTGEELDTVTGGSAHVAVSMAIKAVTHFSER